MLRRRILLALLALMLGVSPGIVVGCGGDDDDEPAPADVGENDDDRDEGDEGEDGEDGEDGGG